MRRAFLLAAGLAAASTLIAACGDDTGSSGNKAAQAENVTVKMVDNAFSPTSIDVMAGHKVSFEFVNDGEVVHEAYIGDEAAQQDHAAEMKSGDTGHMEMGGDGHSMGDPEVVTVEPGHTATMTRTFAEPGTVLIGCHRPGHWEAGMKATVMVG